MYEIDNVARIQCVVASVLAESVCACIMRICAHIFIIEGLITCMLLYTHVFDAGLRPNTHCEQITVV